MSVCRINKLFLSKEKCAFYKGERCENLNATSPSSCVSPTAVPP